MLLNFALRFHQRLHNTNRYTDAFILGYAAEEIEHAGSDAYNYQGVGHPHRHVNIQKGEVVLDLGSGLGIDSLIAEGITEVTHDEFQQLHDLTHQSCAEIAAPPGSANATTTCAGEFMALQSVNSSMHLTVCSGIDDSCITLASEFANMYNGMATDLCPNHADQLAALCNQTHTAQSVISELSGTSSSSTPLGKMLPWSLLFLMSA